VKALVIGCGRVGSSVALQLADEGWDVTAVDEKEEALGRLGESWRGGFVLGHGMDVDVLRRAGVEDADAVVIATDGDNTNLVIAQVATKRFDNQCVVVRVLDPARAAFYREHLALNTVCPTKTAINELLDAARACEVRLRQTAPTG
jgi:trk system potassium uptake protein